MIKPEEISKKRYLKQLHGANKRVYKQPKINKCHIKKRSQNNYEPKCEIIDANKQFAFISNSLTDEEIIEKFVSKCPFGSQAIYDTLLSCNTKDDAILKIRSLFNVFPDQLWNDVADGIRREMNPNSNNADTNFSSTDSNKTTSQADPVGSSDQIANSLHEYKFVKTVQQLDTSENIFTINMGDLKPDEIDSCVEAYLDTMRNEKLCLMVLAAGHGSRLGFHLSKGLYPIEGLEAYTIFELLLSNVVALQKLFCEKWECEYKIPVFILVNSESKLTIQSYMLRHPQLSKLDIRLLVQSDWPVISRETGKFLVSTATSDFIYAPSGNGAVLNDLISSGLAEQLVHQGFEHLHIIAIDNILTLPLDPLFCGMYLKTKRQMGTLSVEKIDPNERVGVFALKNLDGKDRLVLIEYSEMTDEQRHLRDGDRLAFRLSNLCNLLINLSVLRSNPALPVHYAKKTIKATLRESCDVEEVVIFKLEKFLPDFFKDLDTAVIVSTDRKECYAPIKSRSGLESVSNAVKAFRSAVSLG